MSRLREAGLAAALSLCVCGCSTEQSALVPLGREAQQIAGLFWAMTICGALILAAVVVAAVLAIWGPGSARRWLRRERFVVGAGLVFPTVTLSALMVFGLQVMAGRPATAGDADTVRVAIIGEQWWWRVVYTLPDGRRIESANELRIPVDQPVPVELKTADVIHSFWVPNLAGKLDMIPGRTNVLTLLATEPGVSRGQCAEYCGGAHALMAFHVVALEQAAYAQWLEREAADAVTQADAEGQQLFLEHGCGACHAVRGTPANGVIGPDLTHVGSRLSLAAATLPNTAEAFARWITENQHIKPENRMPPFRVFSDDELQSVARYLDGLE